MTLRSCVALLGLAVVQQACAQSPSDIRSDPLTKGPPLEIVHYFVSQWPTGIAVASNGRKFACYPAGLDINNTYNGLNSNIIQVGELTSMNAETAYPNVSYNQSPGGAVNRLSVPPVTKGDSNHLLGVQSVIIDSADTLWILDTGRVQDLEDPLHPMLYATIGGPKLVNFDLKTNQIIQTIVFTADLVHPDSYLNDVRIDHSPNLSGTTGKGAAYVTDSSLEGDNALIFVDLGTGKGVRTATNQTKAIYGSVPFVYGDPMYQVSGLTSAVKPGYITFGADGIGISPDGSTLYFSVIGGRFLYSIATALLRDGSNGHAQRAMSQVNNLGEKGISDGLENDTNGIVYAGNVEQAAISMYNPVTTFATIFVRDPRINWVDTMSVAKDGYLYFTVNQLNYLNAIYPGTGLPLIDRRQRPFVAFRVPLPNGGTKVSS